MHKEYHLALVLLTNRPEQGGELVLDVGDVRTGARVKLHTLLIESLEWLVGIWEILPRDKQHR